VRGSRRHELAWLDQAAQLAVEQTRQCRRDAIHLRQGSACRSLRTQPTARGRGRSRRRRRWLAVSGGSASTCLRRETPSTPPTTSTTRRRTSPVASPISPGPSARSSNSPDFSEERAMPTARLGMHGSELALAWAWAMRCGIARLDPQGRRRPVGARKPSSAGERRQCHLRRRPLADVPTRPPRRPALGRPRDPRTRRAPVRQECKARPCAEFCATKYCIARPDPHGLLTAYAGCVGTNFVRAGERDPRQIGDAVRIPRSEDALAAIEYCVPVSQPVPGSGRTGSVSEAGRLSWVLKEGAT
jgi:hypothetical protein